MNLFLKKHIYNNLYADWMVFDLERLIQYIKKGYKLHKTLSELKLFKHSKKKKNLKIKHLYFRSISLPFQTSIPRKQKYICLIILLSIF